MYYAYEAGDQVVAICWKGRGAPQAECAHRSWEVRILEAVKLPDGRLMWRESSQAVCAFWGDFSQIDAAKERAKVASVREGLPYLISADVGREVRSMESEVIEALKAL